MSLIIRHIKRSKNNNFVFMDPSVNNIDAGNKQVNPMETPVVQESSISQISKYNMENDSEMFSGKRFPHLNYITEEDKKISRKDEVLLTSVLEWYNRDSSRVQQFSDIVKHKNGLSLRIIDWLITNFSKKVSVAIETRGLPSDLYRDYHKNLSAHNKKNFDPFARRQRICVQLFGEEQRFSTIGQLNFFRWFLQKNLCEFLLENKPVIEKHMREYENSVKKRPSKKFKGTDKVTVKSEVEDKTGNEDKTGGVNARCKLQSFSGTFTLKF